MTFLFTDIEGSTRLWEKERERMSLALALHDRIARTAVIEHHGVVVKTTGDGMYAAFANPLDGVTATLQFQQGIADPAITNGVHLRVRCALHLGIVEHRDNDYFGSTVNRTARVMSVAHGGQTLLTQAMVDDVRERLPEGVSLRDLGSVRLKDLSSPEHVYQLEHPALRHDFPVLRSLEATPNNLPQQLTSFIGREREVAEGKALQRRTRLLTLVGMGGMGKTRLSLQIAADVMDAYPDGVWFVDLAPIRDESLVPSVVAQVLGVQEEPGRPLTQTLCAHVKTRHLIIILDNCEHLIASTAALANELLRSAPDVRLIATSREALRVPGEQTCPVFPLTVPHRRSSVDELARSDAVQLFVDRTRLQQPGFELTKRDSSAVADLCARLEGIPLALELAAARMRSMSVHDINRRLHHRFKVLTGGGRVLLERQQTLRALVAWSYEMLKEPEQVLLDRLSIFAGGFDLEAAETVCGVDPLRRDDVVDLVTSLVEKSLVIVDGNELGSRYRQLDTIREFAREYLLKRSDADATAVRHCNHYLAFAKGAHRKLRGPEKAEWLRRLENEHDNLRAAIQLALDGKVDPVLAVKFEVAMLGLWTFRGYSSEGRGYVRATLALPAVQGSDIAHAHALYVGAMLAINQGEYGEAGNLLETCLELRRRLAIPIDIAATLSTYSNVLLHEGKPQRARECEEEALGIFREQGDRMGEAIGLLHLGEICAHVAADDEARSCLGQSLVIARAIEHFETESDCERTLGEIALENADLAMASVHFARALDICRNVGNKRGEAVAQWWIGKADLAGGNIDAAQANLEAALHTFAEFEMNVDLLGCLESYADLRSALGASIDAVYLYAMVEANLQRFAQARSPRSAERLREAIAAARAALGESAFEAAWAEGRTWEITQATRRALQSRLAVPVVREQECSPDCR